MAASEVEIANLALFRMGEHRIESLNDSDMQAIVMNAVYSQALAFVTEDGLWRHARKRAALAEITNDREDDWAYAYQRPSDCAKIRFLLSETGRFDPTAPVQYESEADTIYTDEPDARIIYTRIVTDVSKFSAAFVDTLAWYWAHLAGPGLNKNQQMMAQMLQGYTLSRNLARAHENNEDMNIRTADQAMPDWLLGR